MGRHGWPPKWAWALAFWAAAASWMLAAAGPWFAPQRALGAQVLLRDGRVLSGKLGKVASLADVPSPPAPDGSGPLRMIVFLDDDLRRTFISERQVQQVMAEETGQMLERFNIWQRVREQGPTVQAVGPAVRITPFDEYGRRIFTFLTTNGPVDIRQGITVLTPIWAKVEGESHVWDMRIATSSIPRDVLHKMLLKQINPQDIEHQKRIARFYLQAERYEEAQQQLEAILKNFPEQPELREQLEPTLRAVRQLAAQRLLSELKSRRDAGQHRLVSRLLEKFPAEGVAGEILQAVREMSDEYRRLEGRCREVIQQIDELMAQLTDTALRAQVELVRKEIAAELDLDTLERMAAFRQAFDDADMSAEEKLALAVSGWLVGSDAATVNLPVALSLSRVRDKVRQYLREPIKLNREAVYDTLASEEGATPRMVAALLAHMKPPLDPPEPLDAAQEGLYRLEVPTLPQAPPATYYVQLPPEYNPYRRYPVVVTLRGSGSTAQQQIDWWAGAWTAGGFRAGQATRHGYIVIAPDWPAEHQMRYEYSAREHAAVLNSLRDACRRFSIDTDRVFLSGHSMGGDAAWDIGLAHPDLWAGVIPIVAVCDKYCTRYWENNAPRLPFYVVLGELDGTKLSHNARDLDKYLQRGFNCTVVEYLGRGHEHFSDEILRLFDWMGRLRRNFFPREFTCATMRPWDNFFYWLEVDGLPPAAMVLPTDWPPARNTQPAEVGGRILATNGLSVSARAGSVVVWVSPEMLNLEDRVIITVNGRRVNSPDRTLRPDLRTLLEDARTRADRLHPFWAKIEVRTGRVPGYP